VTDGAGLSASDLFTLTVVNTNDAPTLANAIPDQTATEDAPFAFALPADTFADVDPGDALTLTASSEDGSFLPAWLRFDPVARTFTGTPLNGDVGLLNVKVSAVDRSGASAFDLFALTVANTNDAPRLAHPLANWTAPEAVAFSFNITDGFVDD